MKAVIQRVTRGKVTIEGHVHGEIGRGFVILLALPEKIPGKIWIIWLKKFPDFGFLKTAKEK